jgi:hypothetical protein
MLCAGGVLAGRRSSVRVAASVTAEKAALDISKVSIELPEQLGVWVAMAHRHSGRV